VVFDRFALGDLSVRVLGAPMAGGPSTPALAAAVSNGGGLGFLAAGMLSAEELADSILAARRLTSGALGVNLFVPQAPVATIEQLGAFAAALEDEAEHYGVALGEPHDDDDDWAAKLDVVCDLRPEAVSFTFGSPNQAECNRLSGAGILTLATVTTQAGGHRATFDPLATPAEDPLDDLVSALVACFDCPVVAAGGLGTAAAVRRVHDAGASAVQVGTAFLLADEAGTNPVHRAALRDPQFTETVVTRAFTGRYARALRNRFIDKHDAHAVFGFPHAAMITAPLQAAAVKLGDPHGAGMWTGAAYRNVRTGSATDIVRELAG
jgi:nitronate monooxygenase